ncbi:shikimate dehydrogenase [Chelativorans sp. M5D2P16]|uniref:shikimate dehydrogenase n=1 Tax=Chelativorans sp. M5D2P16 TaxID=3095678 RepID=UPI002ACA5831|nr:shikimate dehydrogenase [Chelativorans sp. M5D2P16]MDZ5697408.1 shikimate dehydrogenase [Chelativorans sp. M5D2P16]
MADKLRAFVCGHPVAHSRSPLIHGNWLKEHGIEGSYEPRDVAPGDFEAFIGGLAGGLYAGGNVTIPHKESAFRLVDRHDAAAEAIGAVNTLWIEDGRLYGGNTDAYGFAANLDASAPGWDREKTATVLGAGGAARAVVHALKSRNMGEIRIVNRTLARAQELAAGDGRISAHPWEALPELLADTTLLVNTTSLGMKGGGELSIDLDPLPSAAVVTDIVYVPLRTPLLAAAARRGLKTVDGLGMLLHQAVPGFERWFGVRPEVTPRLREIVVADLGAGA